MGNPAAELADGLHLLRLEQRFAGLLERLLRLGRFGDVAGDLGKPEQGTGVSPDRVDHDMGQEPRAILAYPPTLVLEASLARRNLQCPSWQAGSLIFGGVEHGKMLADDFFGQITLDALGPQVPVGHTAIRGKHVDGIVGDALHQQPKLLLALLEGLFGHLAVSQVTGDLGKPQERARRVVDRIDHHVGPEMRAVLAHAPAFAFETPLADGRVQRPLGQAGTTIFIGVEAREMLAENLRFLITLETPGPCVPAGNDAIEINHVDRIVHHCIDQQAQAPVFVDLGLGSNFAH
ncbi:hypothetical protein D3C76_735130 [compost metagenome]